MAKFREFLKWYFHVDWKDVTNWIALLLAILLFWYGIKNIIAAIS